MTSKERVLCAINHEEPDRVPVCATYVPEVEAKLREKYRVFDGDIGAFLGNDMIKIASGFENSFYMSEEPEYTDPYGIVWRNIYNQSGRYTDISKHPLASADLDALVLPKAGDDETVLSAVRDAVARYGDEKWIIGSCQCTLFEAAWYLRGLDTFMMDMIIDEDYADALFDKLMEYPMEMGLRFIEMGVDMIWLGDDIATQANMMISPDMWRRFLKPRYAKLFSAFKKKKKDIKLCYHSCGNLEAVIPELMEIGLDVLNPIQPLAMDVGEIKRKYGDNLTLYGTMDVQNVLPFGTPDDVKNEVKRLIDICAPGGGYILSPAHHIQADTSIENIEAFYAAAREYGSYK